MNGGIFLKHPSRPVPYNAKTLQWCHNGRDGVSNHQPHHCSFNRLFRCRSMKTSKLRVTGLCAGNSPVTGEFPTQVASNAENFSIWWRHHDISKWPPRYIHCDYHVPQSKVLNVNIMLKSSCNLCSIDVLNWVIHWWRWHFKVCFLTRMHYDLNL